MSKPKRYKCKICSEFYYMNKEAHKRRTFENGGRVSRTCTKRECEIESMKRAAMKQVKQQRILKRKEWKKEKEQIRQNLGIKKKQSQEPLQKAVNKIARLLDTQENCLARPTEKHTKFDAGHIFSVGSHPSLRYHLWNIHKQSVKSNRYNGGEMGLMLDGLEIRYGKEVREMVESLPGKYSVLKLTAFEKREKLKIANEVCRRLEKGEQLSRDEINEMLGIY